MFVTLVGVFSVMWSELLMTSTISSLWSFLYVCQRVDGALTSPVMTDNGMFVMDCMQHCMSVSTIL